MNFQELQASFAADRAHLEQLGIVLPQVRAYMPEGLVNDQPVMDAQPQLFAPPTNGVPAWFTTFIDPNVIRILMAPTKAAQILGEEKRGDWTMDTTIFSILEHAGEVSSYGDWNNNGNVSVNEGWTTRQAYYFQTVKQYGERQVARAALAKINWVAEQDAAAADVMNRFMNLSYLFGVAGMQTYGILNDPGLQASIQAGLKAYGNATHTSWLYGGIPQATANEVYADIQALYTQLVAQTIGAVDTDTPLVLVMSSFAETALTITNSFGVSVQDLLKKNFPNITIVTVPEFGAQSSLNPHGHPGGEFLMLFAKTIQGQQTGFAAYNEKMRQHPLVPDMSSFKQKVSGGTWGAVFKYPVAVATMVGI